MSGACGHSSSRWGRSRPWWRAPRGPSGFFGGLGAGAFPGGGGAPRERRVVWAVERACGLPRAVGSSEEAPRDRREHSQERPARRADAGRVPGAGHDSHVVPADPPSLFRPAGLAYLERVPLSAADRFSVEQVVEELQFGRRQLQAAEARRKQFAEQAPLREREARTLLRTIPGVGFVTTEVVLAELADIDRFGSQKQVVSYAGLSPGQRESAGKRRGLHLETNGPGHLGGAPG